MPISRVFIEFWELAQRYSCSNNHYGYRAVMGVCVCVCSIYIYTHVCAGVHALHIEKPEEDTRCSPLSLFILFPEIGFLIEPGARPVVSKP